MGEAVIQGPNVKRLIAQKMATDAIPKGGGLKAGIEFLLKPDAVIAAVKEAKEWVALAIQAVRDAADPNPWSSASDEMIAGEILRQIEEKRKQAK